MKGRPLSRARAASSIRKPYRCSVEQLENRLPPGTLFDLLEGAGFTLPVEEPTFHLPQSQELRDSSEAAPALQGEAQTLVLPLRLPGEPLTVAPARRPASAFSSFAASPSPFSRTDAEQGGALAEFAQVVQAAAGAYGPATLGPVSVSPESLQTRGERGDDLDLLTQVIQAGAPWAAWKAPPGQTGAPTAADYGQVPVSFEANVGQTDERVRFLARGSGYTLFLTPTEAVLTLQKSVPAETADDEFDETLVHEYVVRMEMLGANKNAAVVGRTPLAGKVNYLVGDASQWHTNVPTYGRVEYQEVYPGIDLAYYGNAQNELEYDFTVSPGADPNRIGVRFQGVDRLELDAQGDLLLHTPLGAIRQQRPVVYQEVNGARREVAGRYVVSDQQVGFQLGAYDAGRPLVIDPVLTYSTYLGGSDTEDGYAIAVDYASAAYVTGMTASINFPTRPGAFQTMNRGLTDIFVTKLSPAGNTREYSTYLGGNGNDRAHGIAVDYEGNAFLTGRIDSTNFPVTTGAFQITPRGSYDAFATKLAASGSSLVYSTYLGGDGNDAGFGIAVDANTGRAYITGGTNSQDYPATANAYQFANYQTDSFLTVLAADGRTTPYSTFFGGGASNERANAITLDLYGGVYITGQTRAEDLPVSANAVQRLFGGGLNDGYVAKFDPLSSGDASLVWSTFVGGNDDDRPVGIAVDWYASVYITGITTSLNFPTVTALQPTYRGGISDGFVMKLNYDASARIFSTYLGGNGSDKGTAIAVTGPGDAPHIVGATTSTNFPTLAPIQATNGGGSDAFVTKLRGAGNALDYSTYLGGAGDENVSFSDTTHQGGIVLDWNGAAYVIGKTQSANYPTVNPAQGAYGGGDGDAFVAKITDPAGPGELGYYYIDPPTLSRPAGTPFTLTVWVLDGALQVLTNYTGQVAFFSTDPQATLPANYTFQLSDMGRRTFTNGFTLRTPGEQYVLVYDTVTYIIYGAAQVFVQ